eukprot:TRINITY_DN36033_c0_g1_i1.p3 TRINITY_DN36033_c0_g1~~TRINITY_DN36033_c0_g1_i1.p3  ORF type:complete len:137 (+),score=51.23 TRINITY_DN36033_c0_g1_i1:1419-1829(+)
MSLPFQEADPTMQVPEVDVNEVSFKDSDGDTIAFKVAAGGGAMVYSVNSEDRPPFKVLKWHPALGVPGLQFPDIRKGFPLPVEGLAQILGGLRCLAAKAGIDCQIPTEVVVPQGNGQIGLPRELADSLFNQRSQDG